MNRMTKTLLTALLLSAAAASTTALAGSQRSDGHRTFYYDDDGRLEMIESKDQYGITYRSRRKKEYAAPELDPLHEARKSLGYRCAVARTHEQMQACIRGIQATSK